MSKYVFIDQTSNSLPLTDKPLIYVNLDSILYTSTNQISILNSLDELTLKQAYVPSVTKESLVYPRFNLDRICYSIERNSKIHYLPNNDKPLDTETLFNQRALELEKLSEEYSQTYLFWSGGIDSTLVLCSILQNWKNLNRFTVVLNQHSIDEYPFMYNNYINGKVKVIDTDSFFSKNKKFSHENLYTSGEVGGPLISFDTFEDFNLRFPNIYNRPWKNHVNEILKYFTENSNTEKASIVYKEIIETSKISSINLHTVYEFLWWVNFNWGHDIDLISMIWNYQSVEHLNIKQFLEENCFFWFNSQEFQNWTVNLIGQDLMIRDNKQKYVYKEYIYKFNRDLDYFKYKNKEISTPKNKQMYLNKKVLAIDTDYVLYYR
jgi:hypothetical protein